MIIESLISALERNPSRRHAAAVSRSATSSSIRCTAFGTGTNGRVHLSVSGIDGVRVREGVVAENVIVFDTGEFRELTGHDVPWRDAGGRECP
jgi:hypothetical protein